ncbi:hypothetical protein LUZ60_015637 [Juncus effusus]|nr:hypothetical protein LUZ60_015637 [Juncus effusus]
MGIDEPKPMVAQQNSAKPPRRDLVRSYGSAVVTIGEKTYKKIEEQNSMIGWIARKLAFIIFAVIWWIRFSWLSQLSFIDKQIQTVEWILTRIFPSFQPLFCKIYDLAYYADSMPDKLENVTNGLGEIIGGFPYFPMFDWGIETLEEIFSTMLNVVPGFGPSHIDNLRENEMNYVNEGDENDMMYREAIKQKIREVDQNDLKREDKRGGKNKIDVNKDVLELFDSVWHLKNA